MMKKAFTLIELSIVLIIIGLLVGGVLAGRDLIEAAKLRSLYSDLEQYKQTALVFQLKYEALPGDMDNATSFFSGTGNGDGNHSIDTNGEYFRTWQHLALSGLVPGSYSGSGATGDNFNPTVNVPTNDGFAGSGFLYVRPVGGLSHMLKSHGIHFQGSENSRSATPILTPIQAKQVDDKYDDGSPSQGAFMVFNARDGDGEWLDGCTDYAAETSWDDVSTPWDYDLSSDAVRCFTTFKAGF